MISDADFLRLGAIGAAHRGDTGALDRLDKQLDRLGIEPVSQSTAQHHTNGEQSMSKPNHECDRA